MRRWLPAGGGRAYTFSLMAAPSIKICGLTTPATVAAAVRAGASHVGFVFFAPSPRDLAPAYARGLVAQVPERIERVGVFVDADDALIGAVVAAARLSAIQLHGDETPARAADIQARFGLAVWKAVPVRTAADIAATSRFSGAAEMVLLDAKAPDGAALPGGNGVRFDWRILANARPAMPWGLSGGLDAATVCEAVRVTGARLVDVSSGVEDAPGMKSVSKITAFCEAALSA